MARFDQGGGKRFGGNTGGGRSFGGRPSFGRKSFGDRGDRGGERREFEMHNAVCSECQKSCQVPFKPTGEKPVYCSDCFGNKGGRSGGDRPQRRDFGDRGSSRPSFGGGNDDIKRQIEGMNAKLDRLADAIETLSLRWEK
ncbi:MAG: hypothetical protein UT05_C0001G0050 [Parcubacteria group bacterium GW2011_GWF2_38_76]|nr:MAG: hypothetical protein UT05_C0001G0050 [Parcubacteria group bacterium GW2011_GWF2_38_76]HBM45973.1 hypothetical protein [Patescibacteria group bacterium]